MKRTAVVCALLATVATATQAGAFCRARTCNPAEPSEHCKKDGDNCVVTGRELYWGTTCVTFDAQQDGSPKLGIDAATLTIVTERAFDAWLKADCASGHPSMEVATFGPVECAESTYEPNFKNANIVMFRDDGWPYPASIDAFALTVVNYDKDTGQIVDADIEINSADFLLTANPAASPGVDLQTVLTHEVGHFLGLSHSNVPDSTMREHWDGRGFDLKTLAPDDVAGMCDMYPPNRRSPRLCEPRNGFGDACDEPAPAQDGDEPGCSLSPRGPGSGAWLLLLLAALTCSRRARR